MLEKAGRCFVFADPLTKGENSVTLLCPHGTGYLISEALRRSTT